VTSWTEKIIYA